MHTKPINSLLLAFFAGSLSLVASMAEAEPEGTGMCMRNVIAAYSDSKTASLVCLDELEAKINEGIETGLELSPAVIRSRTAECEALEMTKEARSTATAACSPHGN